MHPHDALNEIATLLERERSSRYKSKAFRAAADAIAGLSDEQLRDAASLRRRKGIGDSTFAVIQEALAGEVPGYLADLRERAGRREGVGAARAAARRPALAQRLVGRPHLDRPHGRRRARARARVPGAHRPLAAAAGRERPLAGAAARAARRGRGHERRRLHAALGHRGRHPRRRRARPGARTCSTSSTSSSPRRIRSCGWSAGR